MDELLTIYLVLNILSAVFVGSCMAVEIVEKYDGYAKWRIGYILALIIFPLTAITPGLAWVATKIKPILLKEIKRKEKKP